MVVLLTTVDVLLTTVDVLLTTVVRKCCNLLISITFQTMGSFRIFQGIFLDLNIGSGLWINKNKNRNKHLNIKYLIMMLFLVV